MDYFTIITLIMISEPKKKEGFEGQKAIIIPRGILTGKCEKNDIIGTLHLTDIGYYPRARFHYRKRPEGAGQHILVYCETGEGTASIMNQEFRIKPGNFFIIPRKAPHYYYTDEKNPWTIYWIHFNGTVAASIVTLLEQNLNGYTGYLAHPADSLRLFNEIYGQLEKGYGTDSLIYANMCLSHFLTTFLYNEKFRELPEIGQKSMTDQTIQFFSENLNRGLSLQEMAAAAKLSVSHFSFLFRKKTGFPPLEYFNHLKIQRACQYLLFTNMKIKDIAKAMGVSDPYYFSRSFTRAMGVSPRYYRETRAGQP